MKETDVSDSRNNKRKEKKNKKKRPTPSLYSNRPVEIEGSDEEPIHDPDDDHKTPELAMKIKDKNNDKTKDNESSNTNYTHLMDTGGQEEIIIGVAPVVRSSHRTSIQGGSDIPKTERMSMTNDLTTPAPSSPKNAFTFNFQPFLMLILFTVVNILTYFDRGAIGVCLDTIESDNVYSLNNFQGGSLGGIYMLGYVVASPIFAHYAAIFKPLRLMSVGLFVWSLATLACGLSVEYYTILFSRAVTGVGEASFLCLAPPFINKFAPEEKKSRWLSVFFCAIPVGYALGYIVSGGWLSLNVFKDYWNWRVLFIAESLLMLPLALVCTFIRGFNVNFKEEHDKSEISLAQELSVLLKNNIYVTIVLGYAAQTFVTGAFGFYGIQYVQKRLEISNDIAGIGFGGLTAVCGLVGTAFGGWLLDRLRKVAHRFDDDRHKNIETALRIAFVLSLLAFPLCMMPFLNIFSGPFSFFSFIGAGEFLLFACYAPINSAILWSVEFRYSGLATAMSVVGLHVLGDAISPPILGKLLDTTNNNWNLSMFLIALWLVWSVLLFFIAWRISKKDVAAITEPLMDEPHSGSNNADAQDKEETQIIT